MERSEPQPWPALPAERQFQLFRAPAGMRLEKGGRLLRALFVEQRTGDVDHPSAGPDELPGEAEQVTLERDEPFERRRIEPPARLRIAAPGAGARTRRVH